MELQLTWRFKEGARAGGGILILSPYCVRWCMVGVTCSCLVLYMRLLYIYIYQCHANTIIFYSK